MPPAGKLGQRCFPLPPVSALARPSLTPRCSAGLLSGRKRSYVGPPPASSADAPLGSPPPGSALRPHRPALSSCPPPASRTASLGSADPPRAAASRPSGRRPETLPVAARRDLSPRPSLDARSPQPALAGAARLPAPRPVPRAARAADGPAPLLPRSPRSVAPSPAGTCCLSEGSEPPVLTGCGSWRVSGCPAPREAGNLASSTCGVEETRAGRDWSPQPSSGRRPRLLRRVARRGLHSG